MTPKKKNYILLLLLWEESEMRGRRMYKQQEAEWKKKRMWLEEITHALDEGRWNLRVPAHT